MTVRKTYTNHKPTAAGLSRIEYLRAKVDELHTAIEEATPSSRERACALTNLETTLMWAVKAIVLNDPESKPDPVHEAVVRGFKGD